MLITVNCKDIEPIKHELAVYVADKLGAIPAIQTHGFVITPINDDDSLDRTVTTNAIREYLDSIGEAQNFAILPDGDHLNVHSITGNTIKRKTPAQLDMFSCPHCGFVTSYEVEYNAHKRIHYL